MRKKINKENCVINYTIYTKHVNYKKFITMTVCVILAQGPTPALCNFYLIKIH